MNAIKLLIDDHKKVEDLFLEFEQLGDADGAQKAKLAEQVCKELTVHAVVEEELFYPAARQTFDTQDDKLIDRAEEEHSEAKKKIANIKTMSTGNTLNAEMKKLKEAIEHHVEKEETEMFPKLEKMGMETVQLGSRMMARKLQLISTL